jgi:hypothetical protein
LLDSLAAGDSDVVPAAALPEAQLDKSEEDEKEGEAENEAR